VAMVASFPSLHPRMPRSFRHRAHPFLNLPFTPNQHLDGGDAR